MDKKKLRTLIVTALLIAIIAVLQMTGLGLIRFGVVNISFLCTIVAIGTMTLGYGPGIVLRASFGFISFASAVNSPSAIVAPLMSESIITVLVLCFVPRIMVPIVTYFTHRAFQKRLGERSKTAVAMGAVAGSLCNTILYLGFLLIGYKFAVADYTGLLATVGSIAAFAGLPEAFVAAIVSMPVVLTVRKMRRAA